jgi:hypothetical protein
MDLEDGFGGIKPYHGNGHGGWLLLTGFATPSWHIDAAGPSTPSCRAAGDPDDAGRRRALTAAVPIMPPINGMTGAVCAALGISRATMARRRSGLAAPPAIAHARPRPPRALTTPQRQAVLKLPHAPRFAAQAPAGI